jgi:drug/metabolite transporter (DMT)-like permease
MSSSAPRTAALSPQAFATLLLLACMMAGNHVAARIAMDHGVDVITAVAVRSAATALAVALIVVAWRVKVRMTRRHALMMGLIGTLVALQSAWLYSSVARLPVGLALLAFNAYPLWAAFWAWALYRHRPERAVLVAMPVILFGLILVLTQHEVAVLDGRFRSALTMGIVAVLTFAVAGTQTGLHLPNAPAGWWGLAALTVLYGTGFTVMFTLLPKLGVVGSSPIMNVEPVAALLLAWPILGQAMAPVQWLGAVLVVGAVMVLGLRKR